MDVPISTNPCPRNFDTAGELRDVKPPPDITSSIFPAFSETAKSAELDRDKQRIKAHPLFPLLEILFVKSEELTNNMKDVKSCEDAIQNVIQEIRSKHGCLTSGDAGLDTLMISAIRVLRIHLVELGRVSDLCKEFCERYTSCIKTRINQETLLGFANDSDDEDPTLIQDRNSMTDRPGASTMATIQTPTGPVSVQMFNGSMTNNPVSAPTSQDSDALLCGFQNKIQKQTPVTPHSLMLPIVSEESLIANEEPSPTQPLMLPFQKALFGNDCDDSLVDYSDGDSISSGEGGLGTTNPGQKNGGNSKRASLPRKAVDRLRAWLFQHVSHPYPSEPEKRQLAKTTGLNLLQVNNWFINARRRILQPMLEGHAGISHPKSSTDDENKKSPAHPSTFSSATSPPPAKRRPLTSSPSEIASSSTNDTAGDGDIRPQMTSAQRYWPLAGFPPNESALNAYAALTLAQTLALEAQSKLTETVKTELPEATKNN